MTALTAEAEPEPELPGVVEYAHGLETVHRASTWPGIPVADTPPDHCQQQHRGEIMTVSPDIDPVYDPRAWETYRRNTGCGCTAPTPVDCKIPHGTGEWLCACHRLSGPPTTEPGKPLGVLGTSNHFLEPNRCLSVHAAIFRCRRPLGHPGDHRAGRTFWGRRAEDEQPYPHEPGVVAYRSADGRILRCLQHAPDPSLSVELTPVGADDLPDGGVCTDLWCGADVLIPQERQR